MPALSGCSAPLSVLNPAGGSAAAVAQLWWVMLAGAGAILALVLGLLAFAFRTGRPVAVDERRWLVVGGLLFPAVTLTALLVFAVLLGERVLVGGARDVLVAEVTARQFAWEFRYPERPHGDPVPVLTIPVGRAVDVRVTSADVIHSFWVPRLAGKIDAVPGHVNVVRLSADRAGVYRGQCSEFCGIGHARMDFRVEVVPEEEFRRFLVGTSSAPQAEGGR